MGYERYLALLNRN